ncbi:hypothetical protein WR25_19645 [Diploscapter pachys]|uniref:Phospholipid/glycerol acyltransferase domain-containing protein n=1 Tax=Diploscapter pachys TaxID=2018661 RepID=A0A2A2LTM3_9BILA|nr:hypothetical protein WR25_19645 [Diploscapter pachys]
MPNREVLYPQYVDWLSKLDDAGGPLKWITKQKHFPEHSGPNAARYWKQINEAVFRSERVQLAIEEEVIRRKCQRVEVEKEAHAILDKMGHKYSIWNVKGFGYVVTKVLRRLFRGIYVNEPAMKEILKLSGQYPVIFMPSHKTYMDFILISLICYEYDIELPAIAAGEDFAKMAFMGEVLRRSGAFFMRRSFGKDYLYWAIFSEYVQQHLVHNDRTIEFFVEGGRSRTGKSVSPKYGLIQAVLEPFLKGDVLDIILVPVAMNYDKILEEMLYAYELLGFPKPKETTSALLKARNVLNRDYGKCFVTFGKPISARDYFNGRIYRPLHNLDKTLTMEEKSEIRRLAHFIVKEQNANSILTVWPLACNLFESIDLSEVDFTIKLLKMPIDKETGRKNEGLNKEVMGLAVTRIAIDNYANSMLPFCAYEAIIAFLMSSRIVKNDELEKGFLFVLSLLNREIISVPGEEKNEFQKAMHRMRAANMISGKGDEVSKIDEWAWIAKLERLIRPYMKHFLIVINCLSGDNEKLAKLESTSKAISYVQQQMILLYEKDYSLLDLTYLSSDPIKNAIQTLIDRKILKNYQPHPPHPPQPQQPHPPHPQQHAYLQQVQQQVLQQVQHLKIPLSEKTEISRQTGNICNSSRACSNSSSRVCSNSIHIL